MAAGRGCHRSTFTVMGAASPVTFVKVTAGVELNTR